MSETPKVNVPSSFNEQHIMIGSSKKRLELDLSASSDEDDGENAPIDMIEEGKDTKADGKGGMLEGTGPRVDTVQGSVTREHDAEKCQVVLTSGISNVPLSFSQVSLPMP
jgi:hypothetical protein